MAEVCGALIQALREAMEEAIRRGVPRAAAGAFLSATSRCPSASRSTGSNSPLRRRPTDRGIRPATPAPTGLEAGVRARPRPRAGPRAITTGQLPPPPQIRTGGTSSRLTDRVAPWPPMRIRLGSYTFTWAIGVPGRTRPNRCRPRASSPRPRNSRSISFRSATTCRSWSSRPVELEAFLGLRPPPRDYARNRHSRHRKGQPPRAPRPRPALRLALRSGGDRPRVGRAEPDEALLRLGQVAPGVSRRPLPAGHRES